MIENETWLFSQRRSWIARNACTPTRMPLAAVDHISRWFLEIDSSVGLLSVYMHNCTSVRGVHCGERSSSRELSSRRKKRKEKGNKTRARKSAVIRRWRCIGSYLSPPVVVQIQGSDISSIRDRAGVARMTRRRVPRPWCHCFVSGDAFMTRHKQLSRNMRINTRSRRVSDQREWNFRQFVSLLCASVHRQTDGRTAIDAPCGAAHSGNCIIFDYCLSGVNVGATSAYERAR